MSEWVTGSKYKAGGLRTGGSAAHILVYDRCRGGLLGSGLEDTTLPELHLSYLPHLFLPKKQGRRINMFM